MNIKPISNHLILEPSQEEKTTKGGILLPETAEKERPVKAKVIAVGPGKKNDQGQTIAMEVQVGQMALFKKYGPDEFEFEGKKYLIAEESDILAILE